MLPLESVLVQITFTQIPLPSDFRAKLHGIQEIEWFCSMSNVYKSIGEPWTLPGHRIQADNSLDRISFALEPTIWPTNLNTFERRRCTILTRCGNWKWYPSSCDREFEPPEKCVLEVLFVSTSPRKVRN
jgi:hypothetical protein